MDNRILTLIGYLENNLHHRLSINEMARLVRISPSRLQHIFKKETGEPINQYRRKLRLKKAAELLTRSFLSVKQIRRRLFWRQAKRKTVFARSSFTINRQTAATMTDGLTRRTPYFPV